MYNCKCIILHWCDSKLELNNNIPTDAVMVSIFIFSPHNSIFSAKWDQKEKSNKMGSDSQV